MYTGAKSYMYDSNSSKQFWQVNFMNVVTVCFHNISKDLKHKPDDNCQTGREQTLSALLLWQLNSDSGSLTPSPDTVFLFPKRFF